MSIPVCVCVCVRVYFEKKRTHTHTHTRRIPQDHFIHLAKRGLMMRGSGTARRLCRLTLPASVCVCECIHCISTHACWQPYLISLSHFCKLDLSCVQERERASYKTVRERERTLCLSGNDIDFGVAQQHLPAPLPLLTHSHTHTQQTQWGRGRHRIKENVLQLRTVL